MFVKLLFAGPAFGCVLGFAVYLWLNCFRKYPMTQCLAVVTVCYIAYFVAEVACGLSGPLTAVCYGLFIKSYGHIALDREAQAKHHTFVEGRHHRLLEERDTSLSSLRPLSVIDRRRFHIATQYLCKCVCMWTRERVCKRVCICGCVHALTCILGICRAPLHHKKYLHV